MVPGETQARRYCPHVTALCVTHSFAPEVAPCPCWEKPAGSLSLFCALLPGMLFFSVISSLDSQTPASVGWWQGLWEHLVCPQCDLEDLLLPVASGQAPVHKCSPPLLCLDPTVQSVTANPVLVSLT